MKLMSVSLDNISVETECGSSLCEILQNYVYTEDHFQDVFKIIQEVILIFQSKHFLILFLLFEIGKKECYTSFLITCIYFNFPSL